MDAATRVQLAGLLWTLVLPVAATAGVLAAGHRLGSRADRPRIAGAALLAGLIVATAGVGLPSLPLGPEDFILLGALFVGVAGLGLEGRGRLGIAAGAALLPIGVFAMASRLPALWVDGAAAGLAADPWLVDAAALAALLGGALQVGLGDHERGRRATPAVLGAVALALGAAGLVTALSGSARIGQQLGAAGVAVATVGLAGWRWPALRAGRSAVGAATAALAVALVYVHLVVEVPRSAAALLMLAPLGAFAGEAVAQRGRSTRAAVAAGLAVTAAIAIAAVGLTLAADGGAEADEDGTYYPY